MKKTLLFIFLFGMGTAMTSADASGFLRLPYPRFLLPNDSVPRSGLQNPDDAHLAQDEIAFDAVSPLAPPPADVMEFFSSPDFYREIYLSESSEATALRSYWHGKGDFSYCHFIDMEGNDWYGWAEGHDLHWILWTGHRYWWRDPMAGHWLYYYRGVWWRSDGQDKGLIQAYVDGEYYLCDARGKVLKDMGQDGEGPIVSAPGRYQGDFHGGHGGHGTHQGHSATQPGNSQGPSAPPPSPQAPATPKLPFQPMGITPPNNLNNSLKL